MIEKALLLKWDDFYKFVMSVGILFMVLAILVFFFLLGIGVAFSIMILIIFFPIGFLLSWWAYERWFAKQRLRDRVDFVESLLKEKEIISQISLDEYAIIHNQDPINALLDKEEKSYLSKLRGYISKSNSVILSILKFLFGRGKKL
jgi:hypothetical protein